MNVSDVDYCRDSMVKCRIAGATALLIAISKMESDRCYKLQASLDDGPIELIESRNIALKTIDSILCRDEWAYNFTDQNVFNCFANGAAIAIQKISKMSNPERQAEFAILGIMGTDGKLKEQATRWVEEQEKESGILISAHPQTHN